MLDCGNSECGHSRLKCTTPRRAPASRYIVAFCGNVGARDKLGPGTTASLEPRLIKVIWSWPGEDCEVLRSRTEPWILLLDTRWVACSFWRSLNSSPPCIPHIRVAYGMDRCQCTVRVAYRVVLHCTCRMWSGVALYVSHIYIYLTTLVSVQYGKILHECGMYFHESEGRVKNTPRTSAISRIARKLV